MTPTLSVRARFWRMLAPRWSHRPLSGDGAAKHGGRFNPPGLPTLHMSEEFATAVAEYEQDLGIRPGTLCAYDVASDGIVDLMDEDVRAATGTSREVLACSWKHIHLIEKREPPTWLLVKRLIGESVAGVRVPSVRGAGANLVLWRWNDGPARQVVALDPLSDLPTDQTSWER